jgi:hydrogenase expression/formation protein HypC
MCMAIPSRVLVLDGDVATVECFGVQRDVSTLLMAEPVVPGDYVFVMANAYAVEKVPPEVAAESLAYLASVLDKSSPAGAVQ